jgi:deoxyribonuclease I
MFRIEMLSKELEEAKSSYYEKRKEQPYYDEELDQKMKEDYYRDICFENRQLRDDIHTLIKKTHKHKRKYAPHRYVYPWVDLQKNGKLKSLYSGKDMDPIEVIEQDIKLLENIKKGDIAGLSKENKFNCEHVVPQSWFREKEPMRGDLHHLFACEPACNSMRGNFPYFDFPSYVPEGKILGIREGCGKAEEGKFEPEYGKGIVARATLYFLIRYAREINIEEKVDISLLVKWHKNFPLTVYEKHRNAAIFELQGNRNPFIDFPNIAEEMMNR